MAGGKPKLDRQSGAWHLSLPVVRVGSDRFAYPARGRSGGDRVEVRRIADFERIADFDAGAVTALAADPEGRTVAAANDQGVVALWDSATGAPVRRVIETDNAAEQLAFSADGSWLAARVMTFEVLANRVDRQASDARLLGPSEGFPLAFHPAAPHLILDAGSIIAVYHIETAIPLREIPLPSGFQASELCLSPDGGLLLAGSYGNGELHLWNFDTGEHIERIGELGDHAFSLDFHPSGKRFAACRSDAGAVFSLL